MASHIACREERGAGIGTFAVTSVGEGALLMDELPCCSVTLRPRQACAGCGRSCAEAGCAKLQRCSGCKSARYCSAGCQRADWRSHGLECEVLAGLKRHGKRLDAEGRLVVRILSRVARDEAGPRSLQAFVRGEMAAPGSAHSDSDNATAALRLASLPSGLGLDSSAGEAVARLHACTAGTAMGRLMRAATRAVPAGDGAARGPATSGRTGAAGGTGPAPTAGTGEAPARDDESPGEAEAAPSAMTALGAGASLRLLGLVRCNAFAVVDSSLEPSALALYARASRLNHSCDPTAVAVFTPSTRGHRLALRAAAPIAAGAAVTLTYLDATTPRRQRAASLRRSYGFTCGCSRCRAPLPPAVRPGQVAAAVRARAAALGASAMVGPLAAALWPGGDTAAAHEALPAEGMGLAELLSSGVVSPDGRLGDGWPGAGERRRDGTGAAAAGSAAAAPPPDAADASADEHAAAEPSVEPSCLGEIREAVDSAEASEREGPTGTAAGRAADRLWAAACRCAPGLSPAHFELRRALSAASRLWLAAGDHERACGAGVLAHTLAALQAGGPSGRRAVPVLSAALFAARMCWACGRHATAARLLHGCRRDLERSLGTGHPAVREAMLTLAECAAHEAKA